MPKRPRRRGGKAGSDEPISISSNAVFGRNLREARFKAGMTQAELAAAAKSGTTFIGEIESGTRNVTLDTAERLAGALGLTVADLLRASPDDSED